MTDADEIQEAIEVLKALPNRSERQDDILAWFISGLREAEREAAEPPAVAVKPMVLALARIINTLAEGERR